MNIWTHTKTNVGRRHHWSLIGLFSCSSFLYILYLNAYTVYTGNNTKVFLIYCCSCRNSNRNTELCSKVFGVTKAAGVPDSVFSALLLSQLLCFFVAPQIRSRSRDLGQVKSQVKEDFFWDRSALNLYWSLHYIPKYELVCTTMLNLSNTVRRW